MNARLNFPILMLASAMIVACGGGSSDNTGTGQEFTPGDTGDASLIFGSWHKSNPDESITFFSFFEDGSYAHIRVDAFDEKGLEYGSYFRNGTTGQISTQPQFDENQGTGFSQQETALFLNRVEDALEITGIENGQSVDFGSFPIVQTGGIHGTWRSTDASNDLNMLSFLDNGMFYHAQVDGAESTSGAEWGTYVYDTPSGELTTTIGQDTNGEAGLSGYQGQARLFLNVAGNVLTLSVDTDGNGESDQDFVYMQDEASINDGYTQVTQDELTTLYGKQLRLDQNYITVNSDGTFNGMWSASPIAGSWEMKNDFWCRVVTLSDTITTGVEDCQLWEKNGNLIRGTRDSGNGSTFFYTITDNAGT
ncbi:MAG: hypothetical protein KTR35_13610 [Gammaproteobacteria bacterium]|nr:hypothetical protein [Gammaproteobacteria bacterium]